GREVLEVVGEGGLGGVPARNRLADADPREDGVVQERGDEISALACDRDPPRRWIGSHNLGAHRGCRRDHALAVRTRKHHRELVRNLDELALEHLSLGSRLPIAGARHEGGADTDLRAGAQHRNVYRVGRAHKHEIRAPCGNLGHVAVGGTTEDLAPLTVYREELSLEAEAEEVVVCDEAKLSRMVRDARDNDSSGIEERM